MPADGHEKKIGHGMWFQTSVRGDEDEEAKKQNQNMSARQNEKNLDIKVAHENKRTNVMKCKKARAHHV